MKVTLLPHAEEQMRIRRISVPEIRETIEFPHRANIGRFSRIIAERDFEHHVLRVIYNMGREEAVVIIVIRKRRRGVGGR